MAQRQIKHERSYFDSADYFSALARGRKDDTPVAPSAIYLFKRNSDGTLTRIAGEPFSQQRLAEKLVQRQSSHFDSADWSLALHGLLEFPLHTEPHPVMVHVSQEQVAVVPHPEHEKTLGPEAIHSIASAADAELRKQYGLAPVPTQNQLLKLKLKGRTPHDQRGVLFDSIDWSLKLKNLSLVPEKGEEK